MFIPRGIDVIALDMNKMWPFKPANGFAVGSIITGGDIYGVVQENELIEHAIMLFPRKHGRISWMAPAGNYNLGQVAPALFLQSAARESEPSDLNHVPRASRHSIPARHTGLPYPLEHERNGWPGWLAAGAASGREAGGHTCDARAAGDGGGAGQGGGRKLSFF